MRSTIAFAFPCSISLLNEENEFLEVCKNIFNKTSWHWLYFQDQDKYNGGRVSLPPPRGWGFIPARPLLSAGEISSENFLIVGLEQRYLLVLPFAFIPSVLVNWPKGCTHLISYSLNQSLPGNVKLRPRPLGLWSSHHGAAHPQLRHPSCHPQQPGGDPSDRCSCCWIFFHQGDYCHHTGWELKQNFLAF